MSRVDLSSMRFTGCLDEKLCSFQVKKMKRWLVRVHARRVNKHPSFLVNVSGRYTTETP